MNRTDLERIAALEVHFDNLQSEVASANEKLDQLLTLRNKGAGAFWLASALLGTGMIGAILALIDWIKS